MMLLGFERRFNVNFALGQSQRHAPNVHKQQYSVA